jgi:hypothetical protein
MTVGAHPGQKGSEMTNGIFLPNFSPPLILQSGQPDNDVTKMGAAI